MEAKQIDILTSEEDNTNYQQLSATSTSRWRGRAALATPSRMSSTAALSAVTSLLPLVSSVRVSSVLNSAVTEYGGGHLLDGYSDTCWNSEQGSPQHVQIRFAQPVDVDTLSLTFQGGFVGHVSADVLTLTRCDDSSPLLLASLTVCRLCLPLPGSTVCVLSRWS